MLTDSQTFSAFLDSVFLQADSGGAVIFDPGSSNGSKIDGVRMKPNIRYGYRGICVHHLLLPLSGIPLLPMREMQRGQIFVRQNKIHTGNNVATVLSCIFALSLYQKLRVQKVGFSLFQHSSHFFIS
jgi:hypothetical protein